MNAVPSLGTAIDRLDAAIDRLNDRLAQIPHYAGTWRGRTIYLRGAFVTSSGSLWHCDADRTQARPGNGSLDWTLACKKGRDGRDTHSKGRANG